MIGHQVLLNIGNGETIDVTSSHDVGMGDDGDGVWTGPPNRGRMYFTNTETGEVVDVIDLCTSAEIRIDPDRCEIPGEFELAARCNFAKIKASISSRSWRALTGGAYRFKRSAKPARKRARR